MGFQKQYEYMKAFGLGQRSALNFPDENPGILKWWQKWEGTEKFTVAYGQGVASSPIQLISAVNTIANGGMYVAPKLVQATIDAGGVERTMPPSATHEVIRPEVAAEMRSIMKDVVCRGTAKEARIDGLSIAGKTGTGFIAQKDGGYTARRRHQGVLRQLRRVPARRGPASHDPRVDRPAARRQWRPLRWHRRRPSVPRAGTDDDPRARHHPAARLDGLPRVSVTLGQLLARLPAGHRARVVGDPATAVTSMTHDSRLVEAGGMFACVRGEHHDGHDFAPTAVAARATALLVDHELADVGVGQLVVADTRVAIGPVAATVSGEPSRALRVVGITGTNGKTTTTHLLAAILRAAGLPTTVLGTLSGAKTTPEAPELQQRLAAALDSGSEAVVMEVSSHALALHRVDGTRFAAAVFTNLGTDHLDLHGTVEAYFRAKARLFTPELSAIGVANADDPHGRLLLDVGADRDGAVLQLLTPATSSSPPTTTPSPGAAAA